MGFFLGNRSHKPARVSWNGTNVVIEEYTNLDFGAIETLYLRGASISPAVYDGTVAIEGEVKDEWLSAFDENKNPKNYRIVKIFDKVWLGEDYRTAKDYYDPNNCYIYDETVLYHEEHSLIESRYTPEGWKISEYDDYKNILSKLEANGINPINSTFLKGGVLGFDAPLGGWKEVWSSNRTYVGIRSAYWALTDGYSKYVFEIGSDTNPNNWIGTTRRYFSVRLVKK